MSMNFERVARAIGGELKSDGYTCRLDQSHSHPRLYVSVNGKERFTILSRSANYDEGNLLAKKWQDIRRDVLPHIDDADTTTAFHKRNKQTKTR